MAMGEAMGEVTVVAGGSRCCDHSCNRRTTSSEGHSTRGGNGSVATRTAGYCTLRGQQMVALMEELSEA